MATVASTIPLYCKYKQRLRQPHMIPPLIQLNIKTHLRIYLRVGLPAGTFSIQSPLVEGYPINLLDSQIINLIEW